MTTGVPSTSPTRARRIRWVLPFLAAGLVLAACGSKAEDATTAETSTAPPTTTGTTAPATTNTTAKGNTSTTASTGTSVDGVVVIKSDTDSQLGEILVDGAGVTVYSYKKDGTSGTSNCTGSCAAGWPPVTATSVQAAGAVDGASLTLIDRPDGTKQVAYKGRPLYRFGGDKGRAGTTNGQGVNYEWYVVNPAGDVVSKDK